MPGVSGTPVRDSIRQIDAESWVIGGKLLLARASKQPTDSTCHAFWSDGLGAFFTVSNIEPVDLPIASTTTPLVESGPIQLVHDAGDSSAVFRIGEAFCKVRGHVFGVFSKTTREHTSLAYLHDRERNIAPFTFPMPRLLHHFEDEDRYYVFVTAVPGETLERAWPRMDEASKNLCAERVVAICKELNLDTGNPNQTICGVDGRHLEDPWLVFGPVKTEMSHAAYYKSAVGLGIECSELVLHHNDMGPQNVLVDLTKQPTGSAVGIIDWESLGFVPKDWVRTKFSVCGAMNFDFTNHDPILSPEWRSLVEHKLGEQGYREVGDEYVAQFRAAHNM